MSLELRPYQSDCLDRIGDRFSKHQSTIAVLATGLGKAQPLSSRVLTPFGFVSMGEISVGDLVVAKDGRATSVLGVFPQGAKEVVKVTFSDETSTRCCLDHLWAVQTKSQKHRTGKFEVVATRDLIGNLVDGGGNGKWFLPLVEPVQFLNQMPLPLDPYLLGCLLGDGGIKRWSSFTCADPLEHQDKYDYRITHGIQGKPNWLTEELRSLGLFGHGSDSKFVPLPYKYAPVEDRLDLLRGLMDTDGTARANDGHVEFNSTSLRLANDVCEIVRSLGGCTKVRSKKPGTYTHKGERRLGKKSYRVTVTLNGINPFWLARKAKLVNQSKNQGQTKSIISIEPDGQESCQCIAVSDPSHLYVTDDYILTHNTVIFSHLANRMNQRKVMILAHREELVTQAAGKIHQICGDEPGIEMGAMRSDDHASMYNRSHVIVGSVQTLSRDRRLAKFCPTDFGLLVIDEAHHATGDSYKKVIDHFCGFSHCKLLGVTATPNRADELALGAVFKSEAFNYGIEEAVADGWLVPIHQEVVKVHGLDFSKVKLTKGDLDPTQLEIILTEEKALHAIAGPTVELAGDKPTLVFCVGVHHAQLMAQVICRYKNSDSAAVVVHGETPKEERREIVKRFKDGDIQFLTNCGVFLEGFDAPATSFIAMARPTKSLPLYTQVVGRGTRSLPGVIDGLDDVSDRRKAIEASGKPFMTVLDFVGNAGRHKLVTSADVLGGRYPQEDRDEATEDAAEVGGDVASALLVAKLHRELKADGFDAMQAAIEREAQDDQWMFEQQNTRKDITGEANYSTRSVDPFNSSDRSHSSSNQVRRDPPSNKQIGMLVYLGVPRSTACGYSKRQASAVIASMMAKGSQA